MLYWALKTRNLVAFLGSGSSMSYGRMSWTDLALTHAKAVQSFLKAHPGQFDTETFGNRFDFHRKSLESGQGDQQLLLDLCEQVWTALDENCISDLAQSKFGIGEAFLTEAKKLGRQEFARACFQEAIKQETVDECAHVRRILQGEMEVKASGNRKKPKKGIECDLYDLISRKCQDSNPPDDQATAWQKIFEDVWRPSPLDRAALTDLRPHLAFFRSDILNSIKKAIEGATGKTAINRRATQHGPSAGDSVVAELLRHAAGIVDVMTKAVETSDEKQVGTVHPTLYYALSLALDLVRACDDQHQTIVKAVVDAMISRSPIGECGRAAFVEPARDPINTLTKRLHIRRFATTNYDLELERYLKDFGFEPKTPSGGALQDGRERVGALGEQARDIALDGVGAADLIGFALSSDEYVAQVVHLHGRATRDSRIVVTERDYRDIYIDKTHSAETYRRGLSILFGGNPVLFLGVGLSEADLLRPLRELLALSSDSNPPVLALMPAQHEPPACDAKTLAAGNRHRICILHYGTEGFTPQSRQKLFQCLDTMKTIKQAIDRSPVTVPPAGRLPDLDHDDGHLKELARHIADIATDVLPNLPDRHIRDALKKVLLTAAMRTETAIRTAAFNAALIEVQRLYGVWRTEWNRDPEARGQYIRYQPIPSRGARPFKCRTWVRHFSSMTEHAADGGSVAGFLAQRDRNYPGRRILVVSGGVGAGKGSIFSRLIQTMAEQPEEGALYKAHFFAGFSFSCEVASVWDALIDFLLWPDRFGESRSKLLSEADPLGGGVGPGYTAMRRLDRLAAALKLASEWPTGERLLIGFNAFDMLFHANGEAKNAEIREVMRLLFSEATDAPIDFVVMVRDSRLPDFIEEQTGTDPPAGGTAGPKTSGADMCRHRYERPISPLKVTAVDPAGGSFLSDAAVTNADVLIRLRDRRRQHGGSGPVQSYAEIILKRLRESCSQNPAPSGIPAEDEDGTPRPLHDLLDQVFDVREERAGKKPAEDPFLHEALIRHLALISIPAGALVLARCPQVKALAERAWRRHERAGDADGSAVGQDIIDDVVKDALKCLALDYLILKIDNHDIRAKSKKDPNQEKRYQLHRSVQYYVYRKLGSQVMEPVEFLYFTPTLYGSQASSLPQLHANAYVFLYELVDGLTEYPEPSGRPEKAGSPPMPAAVRFKSLRASLGIVRTLLTLGIVSRLGDTSALPVRTRGMGCLEHHKLVLRWMLHAALISDSPHNLVETPPPFYADETVWLLNEVGVFALAQGCCREAESYFARAVRANRMAEGEPGGAMYRRILLNRGLCAMDMGRLEVARRIFREVQQAPDEELLLRALARGYLGQVEHLAGRYDEADLLFRDALRGLDALHHLRPTSQLRRYRAHMLCKMGRTDDARRELDAAVQAAEAGGFSDFIHLAQVSEARLGLARGAGLAELLPGLDSAEAYADRMDMPRLKVDLLRIRAEIFLSQGETRLPADLVTEALRVANLNDLVPRRIAGTELLSRIYRAQGNLEGAARLLASARRTARSCGYFLAADTKGSGATVV
ncbi:protein of unknown function (plasmid) [Azospirillum lipoferum 4B]|uniref:Uncharacterized protein n=2 Tax=Azospirillum lipoferum TaxID=193 RepID=G7ZD51_AZOL4|nr:protein of unknown function [Azospirillum lipoferum 4B]